MNQHPDNAPQITPPGGFPVDRQSARLPVARRGAAVWIGGLLGAALVGMGPWQAAGQPTNPVAEEPRISPLLGERISPRALLTEAGIDDSHWKRFLDGQALGPDDEEGLLKILFRLPRLFSPYDLQRVAQPAIPADLFDDPAPFRGQVFALRGKTVAVEQVDLPARLAELFEFSHFFRVHLELSGQPNRALLCTRTIPRAWQGELRAGHPVKVWGLFLKLGAAHDQRAQLIFAASRLAWLPERANPKLGITEDHLLLARHGMDVALLDTLADTNRRRIQDSDRECFYQMLATASRVSSEEVARLAAPLNLARVLTQPETQHGSVHLVHAQARRITRVVVADEDIVARFGIDHYYQIDASLPLGRTTVTAGKRPDAERLQYTNSYPATFCVRRLPARLAAIDRRLRSGVSTTENLNESIIVTGWFFKLWAYRSRFTEKYGENIPQVSPMFLAAQPRLPPPTPRSIVPGMVGGALATLAIGLIWLVLWRVSRRASGRQRRSRDRSELRNPSGLEQLSQTVSSQPDFGNLEDSPEG